MQKGEKVFRSLASLILHEFYGTVTIRFGGAKATHVEAETRRRWEYKDLLEQAVADPTPLAEEIDQ